MENQNSSSSNIAASIEELKNKIAKQDDSVEEIDKAHYIF